MNGKNSQVFPLFLPAGHANKRIDEEFIEDFNKALKSGVMNIDSVVKRFGKTGTITGEELRKYLTVNIDFDFDEEKKKALDLFLGVDELAMINNYIIRDYSIGDFPGITHLWTETDMGNPKRGDDEKSIEDSIRLGGSLLLWKKRALEKYVVHRG